MTSETQTSLAKPNFKPSRLHRSEIANGGLAPFISREALRLHSNSSRADMPSEREELTLKPHSWSRVVFITSPEARDRQKPSVFKIEDSDLHLHLQGAINLMSRSSRAASS
jgi:hypothetical protein